MDPDLYIVLPARNVETTLEKAVLSAYAQAGTNCEIIIVENGSIDLTADIAKKIVSEYTNIPTSLAVSEPGKIRALLAGLEHVKPGKPVIFMDTDVQASNGSFQPLLAQFDLHPGLIVASGNPVTPASYTLADKTAYLNLSSFFPLSKKVKDDSYGFPFADVDPQPGVPPQIEKQLKPFFHGRLFCVRDKRFLPDIIPKKNVGDDVFWSRYILTQFGGGSIRTRYDAKVFHSPRNVEKDFIEYRLRIRQQVNDVLDEFPEFKTSEAMFETVRDWSYIKILPRYVVELFKKEQAVYGQIAIPGGRIPWHGDL